MPGRRRGGRHGPDSGADLAPERPAGRPGARRGHQRAGRHLLRHRARHLRRRLPQGSRIVLRADATRFVAWRGDCDEDTGGTRLDCVIRLDRNRTIQVEFGRRRRPRHRRRHATSSPSRCRERDSFVPPTASTAARAARPRRARASMWPARRSRSARWRRRACAARLERRDGREHLPRLRPPDHGADQRRRQPSLLRRVRAGHGSTLTVLIGNGGAGTDGRQPAGRHLCSAAAGSDCSETFAPGTTVLLHATLPGFRSWQGCDLIVDVNYCRLTMDSSRTVAANFGP